MMTDQDKAELDVVMSVLRQRLAQRGEDPSLEEMRASSDAMGLSMPLLEGTSVTPVKLNGVGAELVAAHGAVKTAAILYLHGGGYVNGSINSHRHLVAQLSGASGLCAFPIDYRLAPETPFPGALDDAVAAYQAITSQGVLPSRVIIAGDSAGGGLSVATALALKAKGLPQPAGVFVMSPWSDLSQRGESYRAKAESDLIVTKPALDRWASAYLANRDADNPLASPVHGELDGLAPLLIQVGSEEVLLSDSTKLAERAGLAGVDVRLQIAPGMPHVWHYLWPALSSARAAIGAAGGWMKARVR